MNTKKQLFITQVYELNDVIQMQETDLTYYIDIVQVIKEQHIKSLWYQLFKQTDDATLLFNNLKFYIAMEYQNIFPQLKSYIFTFFMNENNQLLPLPTYHSTSSNEDKLIVFMASKHIYNAIRKKFRNNELDNELDYLTEELYNRTGV